MDRDEYERMARAVDRHWWYSATRTMLEELAAPHLSRSTGTSSGWVLDAAGGSGGTGHWLSSYGTVVTTDLEPSVLHVAMAGPGGGHGVVADLQAMPHPDDSFAVSLCVTALCHQLVLDPGHVVRELTRVTRPGGLVVLMEPGVRRLRRGHDAVTHTARRFSRRDLTALIEGAGLVLVRSTGAYSFLVAPAAVLSMVERGAPKSDVGRNERGMFGVLPRLARMERALLRATSLPFGLSVIAIGRKPGDQIKPPDRQVEPAVNRSA